MIIGNILFVVLERNKITLHHFFLKLIMKLPDGCYIGKRQTNNIMCGGNSVGCETAQIYLMCAKMSDGCHESIAILCRSKYDKNSILDSLSDKNVNEIFKNNGWDIEKNICPKCKNNEKTYRHPR
jgi:hypothetical protein